MREGQYSLEHRSSNGRHAFVCVTVAVAEARQELPTRYAGCCAKHAGYQMQAPSRGLFGAALALLGGFHLVAGWLAASGGPRRRVALV